jgi:hypothetical protein
MIWRIGDGSNVSIWHDPWLPREWSRRLVAPKGNFLLTKVNELIDPINGSWDAELVMQNFLSQDAEMILATPVHTELEDLVAWYYDPRGLFSIHSAYKVHIEHLRRIGRGGAATTVDDDLLQKKHWKLIWSLKCPGKVKQFLWRFTHNSLAIRTNLERRGMELESAKCVMCSRITEEGCHLFFTCKYVKNLWRELYLEEQRCTLAGKSSARYVVTHILQLEEGLQMKVVLLLWLWWGERNVVREGQRRRSASVLAYMVHRNAEDFLELHKKPTTRINNTRKCWTKPPQEWLKVNLDGAFSAELGEGAGAM